MSPPPPALVWEPLTELQMHNHRQVHTRNAHISALPVFTLARSTTPWKKA
jgi:hypothetical protein